MTTAEYNALPAENKKQYQTHRVCECGEPLVQDGHSIGALHAVCPKCNLCPDCEDGAV